MWPTPNASALNEHETPESFLARAEKLKAKGYNGNGASMPLGVAAKLWPMPRTGVHGVPGHDERHPTTESMWNTPKATQGQGKWGRTNGTVYLKLDGQAEQWATPCAHDGRRPGADTSSTQGANLSRDASLWATPTSRDWKSDDASQSPEHSPPLGLQVLQTETAGDAGSKPAVLNPCFVEALMGLPKHWTLP